MIFGLFCNLYKITGDTDQFMCTGITNVVAFIPAVLFSIFNLKYYYSSVSFLSCYIFMCIFNVCYLVFNMDIYKTKHIIISYIESMQLLKLYSLTRLCFLTYFYLYVFTCTLIYIQKLEIFVALNALLNFVKTYVIFTVFASFKCKFQYPHVHLH